MATQTKDNAYLAVITLLKQMGTPAHIKGYNYLRDSILYAYEDSTLLNNMIKGLYKVVADKHKTTAFCVERDIRTAVEITVNRGDFNYLYSIFGNTISRDKGKPTNREFIMAIIELLKAYHV